jgi:hypothetical protein
VKSLKNLEIQFKNLEVQFKNLEIQFKNLIWVLKNTPLGVVSIYNQKDTQKMNPSLQIDQWKCKHTMSHRKMLFTNGFFWNTCAHKKIIIKTKQKNQ